MSFKVNHENKALIELFQFPNTDRDHPVLIVSSPFLLSHLTQTENSSPLKRLHVLLGLDAPQKGAAVVKKHQTTEAQEVVPAGGFCSSKQIDVFIFPSAAPR